MMLQFQVQKKPLYSWDWYFPFIECLQYATCSVYFIIPKGLIVMQGCYCYSHSYDEENKA